MRFRRLQIIVFLTGFSLLTSGCDIIYRMLDKEGAQEKELIGEVIPYEKNLVVAEIQQLLYLYGYNTGKVDGVLGLRTRNAIEKFQKDNGLEPSRMVDQATWALLNAYSKNGFIQEGHLNISLVQTALEKAGFKPGPIDGKLGRRTKEAVLKFQEAEGIKVDGKIGYQTISRLAKYIPAEPQVEQP